ncbi:MAG: OmpH family outer membrane protein [Gemmatimonadaceae bacterium]|nr:OmpH family outer membrane protein [Gemmatimonadaceae bacterium]
MTLSFSSRRRTRVSLPLALASGVALAFAAPAAAQSSPSNTPVVRIGIIDSRTLLQEMPGRAGAESQFALEMAGARELVRSASDSMKTAIDALSKVEADLRPQQRESAMMLVRARELGLEDMVAQLNVLADRRLQELQAPLLAQLSMAVKSVRTRERLAMVLDLAAGAMIVDADSTLNINTLVLQELRRLPPAQGPR